jgi:imidazoleglycerol phosphate synthase glutamine amidotransferase subunit HisH
VATERMFAVQFHPEKSQGSGKVLLDAYAAWVRS